MSLRALVNSYTIEERSLVVEEKGPMVRLRPDHSDDAYLTASTPEGIRQMRHLMAEVEGALARLEYKLGGKS